VEPHPIEESELARRVDRLTVRVEALTALVETLLDRVAPIGESVPVTAEELADVAARLMRLIEVRLKAHDDRLAEMITELVAPGANGDIDVTDAVTRLTRVRNAGA
jgi:ubiquinone biosynthesis protein UbiJ